MPLTPGMCPRAIKAEQRGIYVKMSISTTGAQFPWTRKCVVFRRNAGKNSRHLYRARSFGRRFFSPETRSRSTKVKIPWKMNARQNDENLNIACTEKLHREEYLGRIISRIIVRVLRVHRKKSWYQINRPLFHIHISKNVKSSKNL